jgi:hypothetical protein
VIPEIRRQPPGNSSRELGSAPSTDSDSVAPELSAVQIPANVQQVFQQIIGRPLTSVECQRLTWLHDELQSQTDKPVWPSILEAVKFQLNPQAQQPVAYLRKVLGSQPAKQKDQAKPLSSLAIQNTNKGEHPPIQVGGLVLTRPKERSGGYVVPAEENMRNLYEVAAWFLDQGEGNSHADPS